MTEYLTCENLVETANDLSNILSNVQTTWVSCKLNVDSIVVFQENYLSLSLRL